MNRQRFLAVFIFALLVALLAPVGTTLVKASVYGVHPYDTYDRMPQRWSKRRIRSHTDYRRYYNPYYRQPDKAVLHPFYRNNYEVLLSSYRGVRPRTFDHDDVGGYFPHYRSPVQAITGCRNYSYSRSTYRNTPTNYECQWY